jgi:hypothetical protein
MMMSTQGFTRNVSAVVAMLFMSLYIFSIAGADEENSESEKISGGFFSIEKPAGWNLFAAGACSEFSFVLRDPSQPLRQVFYFGQVGPVYITRTQKETDMRMAAGMGTAIPWIEMPVVDPPSPGNFLSTWNDIARTETMQNFMQEMPKLEEFRVVSADVQASLVHGGRTELVRGVFKRGDMVGQGLFMGTVALYMAFTGGPRGGMAYGINFSGITAPKEELESSIDSMTAVLKSFSLDPDYVNMCIANRAIAYEGTMKPGRALKETAAFMKDAWQKRSQDNDIMAEKITDEILGRERLYDPGTGKVYEFKQGFYEKYDSRRERYKLKNLKPLPIDDYDLWMKTPLKGR